MVRVAWKKDYEDVVGAFDNVRKESIKFNKEKFGNIFSNKRRLESRLWGSNGLLSVWTRPTSPMSKRSFLRNISTLFSRRKPCGSRSLESNGLSFVAVTLVSFTLKL